MSEQEQGPIEGHENLRMRILDNAAGWVEANAPAALVAPGVRDAIVRRVVDDLTDVFHIGNAAAEAETARDVLSTARLYLRCPLAAAGLGESLQCLVVAGKRAALRRLKAPEALADLADGAAALPSVTALIDQIATGADAETCVPTGLRTLDSPLNGGLPRGELTLLGAATGVGKTTLAMQIASEAACQDRGLVLVCSPEMQAKHLWLRLAQRTAGIPLRELRPRHPGQEGALSAVTAAASKISQRANLVLLDRVDADIERALDAAYLMHEQRGPLRLVVLDYAQQLAPDGDGKPRYQVVGMVARQALELAMNTGAAVFLTSQVNVMKDKRGVVVDTTFRESQTIEHKAAVALLMTVRRKDERRAKITIRKNRNGPQLAIDLYYRPDTFCLADLQDDGAGSWPR
jgi:replicative DNA helicase